FELSLRNAGADEVVVSCQSVSCSCIAAGFDVLRIPAGGRAAARFTVHMDRAKGTSQAVMLRVGDDLVHVPVRIDLRSKLTLGPHRAVVNLAPKETLVGNV